MHDISMKVLKFSFSLNFGRSREDLILISEFGFRSICLCLDLNFGVVEDIALERVAGCGC